MSILISHISDTHGGKVKPHKGSDLVILSGDIAGHDTDHFHPIFRREGKPDEPANWYSYNFRLIDKDAEAIYQENWIKEQVIPYLTKKKSLSLEQVVFVSGNHDFFDPTRIFPNSIKTGSKTIQVGAYKIGLLAGVNFVTGEWNDECGEFEIKQRILALDRDIDILVSHSAPYGIKDHNYGSTHTGSQELYTAIFGRSMLDNIRPYFTNLRLHCFGHSHEGRGIVKHTIDGRVVKFSNAATGRYDIHFE